MESREAVRSPFEWLYALQKAKSEHSSTKLTIADVIDRCNDPHATGSIEPTSPRSVDACLRLGVEPYELKFIGKAHFKKNLGDQDLAELAFKHHETVRQERLQALQEERKHIIEDGEASHATNKISSAQVKGFDSADMVAKEAKRLEVVKRRQERELAQLVHFELMRKELQEKAEAKLRKVQERAEAERRAKAEKSKEWHKQQHLREQQMLKEEAEREKEAMRAEVARYGREMEAAARLAAAEKERRQAARLKEQERVEKVARTRRETERLLAKQQAEIDKKKAEMGARDKERERIRLEQQEVIAKKNAEARIKAEARITAALKNNATILAKRRDDFHNKEREAEKRRKQKEEARKVEEAGIRAEEAAKQEQRKMTYTEAQRREADRVAAILQRQQSKDKALAELNQRREHETELRGLQHELDLESKRNKVEAMKRRDLYQRMSLLERINEGTKKARNLLEQQEVIREQRRLANMEASFQRQRLQETVGQMQAKREWGAGVNIAELLSRSMHRPTAKAN